MEEFCEASHENGRGGARTYARTRLVLLMDARQEQRASKKGVGSEQEQSGSCMHAPCVGWVLRPADLGSTAGWATTEDGWMLPVVDEE
jgi:hypothetical protein